MCDAAEDRVKMVGIRVGGDSLRVVGYMLYGRG